MIISILFLATIALIAVYIFYYNTEVQIPKKGKKSNLVFLVLIGFIIRIVLAFLNKGHPTDMLDFDLWSEMLKTDGLSNFYTANGLTDYPPGYMYILYCLGYIKDIFGENTIYTYVILKLPAIISDILCAVCVYKLCDKHGKNNYKVLLAGFFILNPAVIFNSAVWGQVDSVFTLFVILMLYALTENKMSLAYAMFGVAIFIKPQALFYAPVLFYGFIDNVFLNQFKKEKLIKDLLSILGVILGIVILMLPFGLTNVILQYKNTLASYNYATVNAYNLWSALGSNWAPLNKGMSFIGYFFIFLTVIVSAFVFFSSKDKSRYFLTSAYICLSVFVLSVKMHERYMFPVMALLLCSYALSHRKQEMYLYMGVSLLQFLNLNQIYKIYSNYTSAPVFSSLDKTMMIVMGLITVFVYALFCTYLFKKCSKGYSKFYKSGNEFNESKTSLTKKDAKAISIITLVYSAIALFNLGSFSAPQTFEITNDDIPIVLDLGEDKNVSKLNVYLGAKNVNSENAMYLYGYDEGGELTYYEEIHDGNVFYWETFKNINSTVRFIEIYGTDTTYIGEIGIFGTDGKRIYAENAPQYVIDEQNTVPVKANYLNSTYFDEIYHARTAYEFKNEMPVYEWTHPPLGKSLISVGISIFGMNPFGWRIIGTLFGILMVPILYIFTKKLFGTTWISILSTIIFSFDFMHFTQTRIATIDVYVTFFIMLMYLFMYKYISGDLSRISICKTFIPLGLSGICMGLGIASKWTGVYAGAGLAVIFFSALYIKYKKNEIDKKYILRSIYFCLGAFVLAPLVIYILSYIPFMNSNGTGFAGIIENQSDMLTYHGKTVVLSGHPFSSSWYQWLINYRPIWYYTGTNGDLSENISAFGNPAVWISGLVAFIYCLYDAIRHKNKNAAFLVVAYLAQLLPWMLVQRTTFIYHYFPCVPFLVLMIAHSVHRIYQNHKIIKPCFIAFTIVAVLLFIIFYPVISGFPVQGDFVRDFLRLLPSWQLIG